MEQGVHFMEECCPVGTAPVILVGRGQRAFEMVHILFYVLRYRGAVDVLGVVCSVLAEDEQVHIRPCHLAEQIPLHLFVLAEVEEAVVRGLVEGIREVFPEDKRLLPPDGEAVGVVAVPGEVGELIERIVFLVGLDDFAQVFAHYLIFVTFHDRRHLHPGGVDVRTQMLSALFGETVVEEVSVEAVPLDEIELKVEVIIEAVRCH